MDRELQDIHTRILEQHINSKNKNNELLEVFEALDNLSKQEIIVQKGIGGIYMDGSVQTISHKTTVGVEFKGYIETLKQVLVELEATKEAKPSEAIKDLESLRKSANTFCQHMPEQCELNKKYADAIKQALLNKSQKELAFDKIQSIIDTYYTSYTMDNESALKMIDEIVCEVKNNE